MGGRGRHVLLRQHAQQLGIRLQHIRTRAHHPPQFRKRDDHGRGLVTRPSIFSNSASERGDAHPGRDSERVGGCAVKSKSMTDPSPRSRFPIGMVQGTRRTWY